MVALLFKVEVVVLYVVDYLDHFLCGGNLGSGVSIQEVPNLFEGHISSSGRVGGGGVECLFVESGRWLYFLLALM